MYRNIPKETYDYLSENPRVSGKHLYEQGLATSPRPGRRWKGWFQEGKAQPVSDSVPTSLRMQEWEEDQEDEFDIDAFLDLAPKMVRQAQHDDPIFTEDEINFHTDKSVGVIFPSCMHLGGRYTAYEDFRTLFDQVLETPRLFWGSLGDDIEGYLAQFRDVSAVYEQLLSPYRQKNVLEQVLSKLGEKVIFGMSSQHGGVWWKKITGEDPIKKLYVEQFGVPYYDGQVYLNFVVCDQTYRIAAAHEFKGHSQWNPSHPQNRALHFDYPNADVVVMGDKHFPSIQQYPAFLREYQAGNRPSPMVTLLQAGTAKTGPDPYTIRNWPTGYLGWPILIFHPDQHRIEHTWYVDVAQMLLSM